MLPVYEQLNLREWPFRVTPDPEFAAVWAGRKETKEQLLRLLRRMVLAPRSSLHLMWANFGMGKTHTLYHIVHLAESGFPDLVPVYAVLPRQARGFTDVYRAIAQALPLEMLGDRLIAVGSGWSRDLGLHPVFAESPDVAHALLATLSRDPDRLLIAREYLCAEPGLSRSALNMIGVSRAIRSPDDSVHALVALTRLLAWNASSQSKALIMIDEFQRVGELTPRVTRDIGVGLHTFFNACSSGLGLILSFSFGRQDNIRYMLSDELRSRAEPRTISFDIFDAQGAREFIRDLLAQFRLVEAENDFAPFTEAAVDSIIDHVGHRGPLTPRRLMHFFNEVLQEWVLDGNPGGRLSGGAARRYLSSPGLGELDEDGE